MINKLLLNIFLAIIISASVSAQHFISLSSYTDGGIRNMLVDSATNLLYLSGEFSTINGVNARGIATFDGVNFDSLDGGTDANYHICCPNPVYGIGFYKNNFIAGGAFDNVDNKPFEHLAQWNGNQWDSIPGWDPGPFPYDNVPMGFIVYNNDLYVGGSFAGLGGNPDCVDLAKWDGTQWIGFSTGIDPTTCCIDNFCIYDNKLFYAGYFGDTTNTISSIGYMDSTGFHGLGFSHFNQSVFDMVVYHNELYVGGQFNKGGGNIGDYIMKWNGTSWSEVGGGMDKAVRSLKVYNDNLYAGGTFTTAGGINASCIARWDGVSWYSLSNDLLYAINDIAFYKNELYIATDYHYNCFAKFNGVLSTGNIASPTLSFSLSPNPATKNLVVSFPHPLTSTMLITNTLGQTVSSFTLAKGELKKEEDISGLVSGVYFVVLQTEEGRWEGRFVKQ